MSLVHHNSNARILANALGFLECNPTDASNEITIYLLWNGVGRKEAFEVAQSSIRALCQCWTVFPATNTYSCTHRVYWPTVLASSLSGQDVHVSLSSVQQCMSWPGIPSKAGKRPDLWP